jgi:hypothetical protein
VEVPLARLDIDDSVTGPLVMSQGKVSESVI